MPALRPRSPLMQRLWHHPVLRVPKRIGHSLIHSVVDTAATLESPFHGIYDSYEGALQSIPEQRRGGYDDPAGAALYQGYMSKTRPSDYPVLFWLHQIINRSVFDLGGHVGTACYLFQRYMTFPNDLRWIVCELPEMCRVGSQIAAERNESHLVFTTEVGDADGADVLLASGSLQFMKTSISSILAGLERKPSHILINRTPLSDGASFFSIQDLGTVVTPFHVFNRREFIDSIQGFGYELVDSWAISEPHSGTMLIPFHPEKSLRSYTGIYFRRHHD